MPRRRIGLATAWSAATVSICWKDTITPGTTIVSPQEWLAKRIWKPTLRKIGVSERGQYNIKEIGRAHV